MEQALRIEMENWIRMMAYADDITILVAGLEKADVERKADILLERLEV